MHDNTPPAPSILLVGASRGLGHAMAGEFAHRGWTVLGTARSAGGTALHELAHQHPDRVLVETLDVTHADQIAALRQRLDRRRFDVLFVNAGITHAAPDATMAEVDPEAFSRVMLTNAFGPMRTIELLGELVTERGLIGIMSSGQGSVANNTLGGRDLYRGSKAALNMFMRSYAARHADSARALLLLAPGWIRTELGGPDAPFTLEQTIPDIVDCIVAKRARPGLEYLDRHGQTVPW